MFKVDAAATAAGALLSGTAAARSGQGQQVQDAASLHISGCVL
jgi:hypothetical protein